MTDFYKCDCYMCLQHIEYKKGIRPNDVVSDVVKERDRQDKLWGEQNHRPEMWMTILMEEVGEAAKAIQDKDKANYIEELKQVAAVAVAAVESANRGNF